MAPQDDLTAERAEYVNQLTDTIAQAFVDQRTTLGDCRSIVAAALKTARQEALREGMTLAAEEADMHVCDDPRFCHCSSRIYKAIMDRLASEGG